MNFSVPTNWDFRLIDRLRDYPIHDIYGVLDRTIVGGGRPSLILPTVSKKHVERYVEKIHSRGMKFTYLLNSPCLNNLEYSKGIHRKLIRHLKWINKIGVDYVTVTIPFFAEIIKNQFPRLKIKISTIAHVNSIQKAKMLEELGVDEITLDFMINRDFSLLEKIRKSTKCRIRLVLNDICLYQCAFRYYHYNVLGHASQTINPLKGFYIDYCLIKCSIKKFTNPAELLKSRWIRPEDLKKYEEIGIDSFKVCGRKNKRTDWILNAVKAYSTQKHEGNLLEIIDCIESAVDKNYRLQPKKLFFKNIMQPFISLLTGKGIFYLNLISKLPIGMYKSMFDLFSILTRISNSVYIDNQGLNGFIDFFKKNNCLSSCEECGYCREWSKKVIRFDQRDVNEYVVALNKLFNNLTNSRFSKFW
ncbi:MAG: U32 family peptidase [Candidatus Omnitrophica bacterium]|nr:U32 family peptidase [Candidatus Omnitrophota bacterium]